MSKVEGERNRPVSGGAGAVPAAVPPTLPEDGVLDRRVSIGTLSWPVVLVIVGVIAAILIRLVQLNISALSEIESRWAYQAFALYMGKDLPTGDTMPNTSPLFLLTQVLSYFLFGTSDVIARLTPALYGFGLLGLLFALRRFVSGPRLAGLVLLVAVSPSIVFASRTVDPVIAVAFCALLIVVAVLRAGQTSTDGGVLGWSALVGVGIGGALASAPVAITSLIAIAIALAVAAMTEPANDASNSVRPGLRRIGQTGGGLVALGSGLIATVIVLFTRFFSELGAIQGLGETFADWGRLMVSQRTTTPVQFFIYAIFLYEILSVVFGIVALAAPPDRAAGRPVLPNALFATWFVVELILQSFANGRRPDQTVAVTLPLVLLAGLGLGALLERLDWRAMFHRGIGLIPLSVFGIVIGLIAIGMLFARRNDPGTEVSTSGTQFLLELAFIVILIILPLCALSWDLSRRQNPAHAWRPIGKMVLLVAAVILGAYTFRSCLALSLTNADDGNELLAQRSATQGMKPFVNQTLRLSRDVTLPNNSMEDNTGSYGISIAVAPEVQWPYLWYFRDFPHLTVAGPAGWSGADMVIAPTDVGMAEAGYVVQSRPYVHRVPPVYQNPDTATVLSYIVNPGKWYQGIRYLLFRELPVGAQPENVSVGYNRTLANQLNPNAGPFNLFDQAGTGSALGQFTQPTGITLSPDKQTIYVIDGANQRIERFAADGKFIGTWGGPTDPNLQLGFQFDQGASGITTDSAGRVYVADTWMHRIVVLDQYGQIVREIGKPGQATNLNDSPDPTQQPGLFFGPRGIAVANNEIYVTDTGNERVQVFAPDGSFRRAFGGYGTQPGKLVEPTGIAISPDGLVYVADSGNDRLSVFTTDGQFVKVIPIPAWQGQQDRLNYLAFSADGLLYFSTPSQGTVTVMDVQTGQALKTFEGANGIRFKAPFGVALSGNGNILVVDDTINAVFELPGDITRPAAATPPASPAASPAASTAASPGASPVGSPVASPQASPKG